MARKIPRKGELDEEMFRELMGQQSVGGTIAPEVGSAPTAIPAVKVSDYQTVFLKPRAAPKGRHSIYLHKETKEQLAHAVHMVSGGKISLTVFIENILRHHIETYREELNRIHRRNTSKGIL